MNAPVLTLCLFSFALLASLPFVFFRDGRPTAGWWLTAGPFFIDAALLLAALVGLIAPVAMPGVLASVSNHIAVVLGAMAITLIGCTIGVHSNPVSMWHQDDDRPTALVTCGPYARIRHPFYASFILMLTGAALAMPHPGTLLLLAAGTVQLHRTARREEHRLLAEFGAEYASYLERTGRFIPRFGRRLSVGAHVIDKLAA